MNKAELKKLFHDPWPKPKKESKEKIAKWLKRASKAGLIKLDNNEHDRVL